MGHSRSCRKVLPTRAVPREITMNNRLPFEGITVIALEQAVAAPLCTSRLAEAGARVIKVERTGGDFARNYDVAAKGESSYFVWVNQGKESLELNLKDSDDQALLKRIVAKADVFIQNLAPGATQRLGFGSDDLRAQFPRLITCDITGYGDTGSYQSMKAYDFLVQCETGLVSISGAPDAPGRVGVSVCDIGAGLNALTGIQQALFARERTGQGSGVKVSLFDTLADWMNVPAIHEKYGEGAPKPAGMKHPSIAPYGGFTSKQGDTIAISIQNEREWVSLCTEIIGNANLATDQRFKNAYSRVENRNELDELLQSTFSNIDTDSLCEKLYQANIAFGRVNSVKGLLNHPQLRLREVKLQDGQTVEIIAPAVQSTLFENTEPKDGGRAIPKAGQHNAELRKEFFEQGE